MAHYARAVGRKAAVFTAVGLMAHSVSPALGQSLDHSDPSTIDFLQIGLTQDSLLEVGNSLFTFPLDPSGTDSLDLYYNTDLDAPSGGVAPKITKSSNNNGDSSALNWAIPAGLGFLGSYLGLSGFGSNSGSGSLLSTQNNPNGNGSNGNGSNGNGSNGNGSNGNGSNGNGSNGNGSNGNGSNGNGSNGNGGVTTTSTDNPAVPEPGTLALCVGLGISGTLFARRRGTRGSGIGVRGSGKA